jgi:hypothetical protein
MEKKEVLKLINLGRIISIILMIAYILLEVAILTVAIITKFNSSFQMKFGKFDLLINFTNQIFTIAILFCLIKIFSIMRNEQRFFASTLDFWVRAISIIVIVGASAKNTVYNLLCGIFNSELKLSFLMKINFTGLIIGIALLILSFIIRRGIELQKQDDETL